MASCGARLRKKLLVFCVILTVFLMWCQFQVARRYTNRLGDDVSHEDILNRFHQIDDWQEIQQHPTNYSRQERHKNHDPMPSRRITTPYNQAKNNDIETNSLIKSSRPHGNCSEPVRVIGSLKLHKAGSTTVMNILQRYAYNNNLTMVLPKTFNNIVKNYANVLPAPTGDKFNMLINHVDHFNLGDFRRFLPSNAKLISIVREPLDLTISAFQYLCYGPWKVNLYVRIPGKNKLQTYLGNREKYDHPTHSYTNNHIAYYFGLNPKYFRNKTAITMYLKQLDQQFDLVMVLEHFAESVILLRRLLCWTMKDVLFVKRNAFNKKPKLTFTAKELAYHRNFSFADYMFYDHFVSRLQEKLSKQLPEFWEEVDTFKSILNITTDHCLRLKKNETKTVLDVPPSKFNDRFEIRRRDCDLLLIHELAFCDLSRRKQYPKMHFK